ncbi:MAG: OmpA family protein [Ginsengibacter sp.]|jgi:chemotaxis protein MotB
MKKIGVLLATIFLLVGCVPKKYLMQSQNRVSDLQTDSLLFQRKIAQLNNQINGLNQNIQDLNTKNSQLGTLTEDQQNKLNQSQKELQRQQQRFQSLQSLLAAQKAASDALKNKMAEALKGFNSSELTVYQKEGKVYVSLSENLLFPSGSAVVNPKGVDALSKLAEVLNTNTDVSVNIEGHTDSIPIKIKFQDNWDLSTARANSIVRILVNDYKVDPKRVVSSGHSFYEPISDNSTPEGRAKNRRTEIILSPKLEEMYQLLSP